MMGYTFGYGSLVGGPHYQDFSGFGVKILEPPVYANCQYVFSMHFYVAVKCLVRVHHHIFERISGLEARQTLLGQLADHIKSPTPINHSMNTH